MIQIPRNHIYFQFRLLSSPLLLTALQLYPSMEFCFLYLRSCSPPCSWRIWSARNEKGARRKETLRPHPNDLITHLSAHCFRPPHALSVAWRHFRSEDTAWEKTPLLKSHQRGRALRGAHICVHWEQHHGAPSPKFPALHGTLPNTPCQGSGA